ncbi:MAG: c-type cytochrome [Nitrospirota bacterium]
MRKKMIALSLGLVFAATAATAVHAAKPDGKALFEANCAVCHKNGGNIINPQKTLSKKDRENNGVRSASDIVKKMRNPGPGMTKFDKKTLPDKDAKAIAEYIENTFR